MGMGIRMGRSVAVCASLTSHVTLGTYTPSSVSALATYLWLMCVVYSLLSLLLLSVGIFLLALILLRYGARDQELEVRVVGVYEGQLAELPRQQVEAGHVEAFSSASG